MNHQYIIEFGKYMIRFEMRVPIRASTKTL